MEIPANGMSFDLLRMVYRNSSIPLTTRIRCAIAAFPFELPKLAVTAVISELSCLAGIAQKKFPTRRRDGFDKDAINTGA